MQRWRIWGTGAWKSAGSYSHEEAADDMCARQGVMNAVRLCNSGRRCFYLSFLKGFAGDDDK